MENNNIVDVPATPLPTAEDIENRIKAKLASVKPQPGGGGGMTPKKVMLGLPGCKFSATFLACLVQSLFHVWQEKRYDIVLSMGYSSFVAFSRMKTLGLDVKRGPDQKPFDDAHYDVFVTIDDDVVFTPQQFVSLIEGTDNHPVVSGMYKMANATNFACVKDWDEDHFRKNGAFHFLTPDDVKKWKEDTKEKYMEVAYNGMGFFACRKDVLDKLQYPYFWAPLQEIKDEAGKVVMRDMCSEDVAFCKNIRDAGMKVFVDTDIIVGHEKNFVV